MTPEGDTERELRLELLRLDRELKLRELRRLKQELVFTPIKLILLPLTIVTGAVAILLTALAVW